MTKDRSFLALETLTPQKCRRCEIGHSLGRIFQRSIRRSNEDDDRFWDYGKGISLGCPLSPLIGAFFLKRLDERMERSGLFYVRFMDDILVLAPTRWRLRKAVKAVNEVLGSLGLLKHPDKTFIGRIERGFDLPLLSFRPGRAIRG